MGVSKFFGSPKILRFHWAIGIMSWRIFVGIPGSLGSLILSHSGHSVLRCFPALIVEPINCHQAAPLSRGLPCDPTWMPSWEEKTDPEASIAGNSEAMAITPLVGVQFQRALGVLKRKRKDRLIGWPADPHPFHSAKFTHLEHHSNPPRALCSWIRYAKNWVLLTWVGL